MSVQFAPAESHRRHCRCIGCPGGFVTHVALLPVIVLPTAGAAPTIKGDASAQGPKLVTCSA